jgi:hypothetical protein
MGNAAAASAAHDAQQDEQALTLRSQGRSFGAIATAVGFDRAHHAHAAFNRALRRKPAKEQAALRAQELGRLDEVAANIRANPDWDHQEVVRRLKAVDRLKAAVSAP